LVFLGIFQKTLIKQRISRDLGFKKGLKKVARSKAEDLLNMQLLALNLDFVREYRFAAHFVGLGAGIKDRLEAANLRDWRFDFAFLNYKLAVEVEGGGWINGRHNRGSGFENDLNKYDAALNLGWLVYRTSPQMVKRGQAAQTVQNLIKMKQGKK